jgi:RHS repeat-associated protein
MEIPVTLTYGTRGVGAGGLGWDIPLSYVHRNSTIAHRRPAWSSGGPLQARQQLVLSLGGRTMQMIPRKPGDPNDHVWIAQQDAPQLELHQESEAEWRLLDGSGHSFAFTKRVGNDLWLLSEIHDTRHENSVKFEYEITSHTFAFAQPDPWTTSGIAGSGTSLDLTKITYNTHPTVTTCTKDEIYFHYSSEDTQPLSLSFLGIVPIVRMRTLSDVAVMERSTCDADPSPLRTYEFTYADDVDTGLPQLAKVNVTGRNDRPDRDLRMPIATYEYGAATTANGTTRALIYEPGTDVALPDLGTNTPPIASAVRDGNGPDGGHAYVQWQDLIDISGDGRPDIVYEKNGQLWAGINKPTSSGTSLTSSVQQLSTSTFSNKPLAMHSSESVRYHYAWESRDQTWKQVLDANGDGRLDIVDAASEPNRWVFYINTPSTVQGEPVRWLRKPVDVTALRAELEAQGHVIEGDYVPLSRRTTGQDVMNGECWKLNPDTLVWEWWPLGFVPPSGEEPCLGELVGPGEIAQFSTERTYVEWEIKDINGDGYPDVAFNSSPVERDREPPPYDGSTSGHYKYQYVRRNLQLAGGTADIRVAFNTMGVRLDGIYPFSSAVSLGGDCGVGIWVDHSQDTAHNTQWLACGLEDVNGDGIPDHIVNGVDANLGTGVSFSALKMRLPSAIEHRNPFSAVCGGSNVTFETIPAATLRDVTGDHIPDMITEGQVSIGTGRGFRTPIAAGGPASLTVENCGGDYSRTISGLYDLDGDGTPEYVEVVPNSPHLEVRHLVGSGQGRLGAGRLISIKNGFGATTTITYRSAKEDSTTLHQVPFPEIVVTSVETTGTAGLGGSLSAVRYAYGDAQMFFDPMLDAFTMRAYGRSVEVHGTGREDWDADYAIIREPYPLDPFDPSAPPAERFQRYQRAGRLRDTHMLNHVPRDPWELLVALIPADPRVSAGVHDEWTSRYQPTQPTFIPFDCIEVSDPYNWALSLGYSNGYNPCAAAGFGYRESSESWQGWQAPSSSASNVQTRVEVTKVDEFGNIVSARNLNDKFRADDDVCIDMTYAVPGQERVLSLVATRQLSDCVTGAGAERHILGADTFEYDELPVGSVGLGLLTSHTLKTYATDTGTLQKTIRQFDLGYDSVGNVNYMVTAREDGAVKSITTTHDEFGLVPISSTLDATGIDPLQTIMVRDPIGLDVISATDANGTTRRREFDAFGRELLATVQPPNLTKEGVVSTTTYAGFDGADPNGRMIRTKSFRDPVSPDLVASTSGQEAVAFLDELGRTRRVEQLLGDDYDNKSLVVLSHIYDGLGRISFDADPHPAGQDIATIYGTSYQFATDGTLECSIRGYGPQPRSFSSDPAAERFPTCTSRVYQNHTVSVLVNRPDALSPGPQQDVTYIDTMSAIGWVLRRETVRAGAPRYELSDFAYDHLGQLASMTRYRDPASALEPVWASFRMDSAGNVLSSTEPESAIRTFSYSDWGELLSVDWTDTTTSPAISMQIERSYDALGRLVASWELKDDHVIPESRYEWLYDHADSTAFPAATYTAGRLTQTKSSIGDVHLSYDAFGRAEARAFSDSEGQFYFEHSEHHFDGSLAALEFKLPDTNYSPERYVYAYDSASRLKSVAEATGDRTQLYLANALDSWGRVRSATYGRNTTFTATYADKGRNLPLEESFSLPGGRSRRVEYEEYDARGREVRRREFVDGVGGTVASGFDALGRLEGTTRSIAPYSSTGYTYDPLGNIRSLTNYTTSENINLAYSSGDRDRLCGADYGQLSNGLCNVVHDGSGNVVSMPTQSGNDRILEYYPSGAIARIDQGATTAQFRYDGSGEISELDISGAFLQDARHDRRYGLFERRDVTVNGDTQSIIVRSIPGEGGIIASRRGSHEDWIFPFGDGSGTRFTSDDTAFVQDVSYLSFGKATSSGAQPGSRNYTNYQWNGGDALLDVGVVHLGARLYDPAIGRFLSRDPLLIPRSATTTNPYAFAFNDPINFADPSGLDPLSICGTYSGKPCGSDQSSSAESTYFTLGIGAVRMFAAAWGGDGNGLVVGTAGYIQAGAHQLASLPCYLCAYVRGVAKGAWHAVTHPVQTAKSIANGIVGAARLAGEGWAKIYIWAAGSEEQQYFVAYEGNRRNADIVEWALRTDPEEALEGLGFGVGAAGAGGAMLAGASRMFTAIGRRLINIPGAPATLGSALPDGAWVVRGGQCTAQSFRGGSGVTIDAAGKLQGVSVNSGPYTSIEQLSGGIPNGQLGVTNVGAIRAAGGTVTPSPTFRNPYHCTMCGISPEQAQRLFQPTFTNPKGTIAEPQ